MEQMLRGEYGIQALSLCEIPSGWSASAWKVHSGCGDYFLKVYDKHKPSTKSWAARIDIYMPVVLWLYQNTKLHEKMTAPVLTKDGSYQCEDESFKCIVFPFITGEILCGEKLKPEQVCEIAQIVSELHSYSTEIPVPTNGLKEDFDVSFCTTLISRITNIHHCTQLEETLAPHIGNIIQIIDTVQKAAALLIDSQMRYTLCHTDIHGWNLIQSESLILIDWEGLKLAPAEADLFSFSETFFFEYAQEEFMSIYSSVHKAYRINRDAMKFYRFRRRLEDIFAFVESILFDDLTRDDMNRSLRYLQQECERLGSMC